MDCPALQCLIPPPFWPLSTRMDWGIYGVFPLSLWGVYRGDFWRDLLPISIIAPQLKSLAPHLMSCLFSATSKVKNYFFLVLKVVMAPEKASVKNTSVYSPICTLLIIMLKRLNDWLVCSVWETFCSLCLQPPSTSAKDAKDLTTDKTT